VLSLETLVELAKPWAKFYSKSHAAQTVVIFAHVAGMLGGGGLAIAADRAMWKARTAASDVRTRLLSEVDRTHRPVLIGLALVVISGLFMAAADIETFGPSPIFWGKMAAFVLLLVNGAWLQSIERGIQRSPVGADAAWAKITTASRISYALWFTVALGGVLLKNA
jgi:hypothetical protein